MNNQTETNVTVLSASEVAALDKKDGSVFQCVFPTPFTYEGKTYDQLIFDWGKLTGNDILAVEEVMRERGHFAATPESSAEYLILLAIRACTTKVGDDVLAAMPLTVFYKIRDRIRNFLFECTRGDRPGAGSEDSV